MAQKTQEHLRPPRAERILWASASVSLIGLLLLTLILLVERMDRSQLAENRAPAARETSARAMPSADARAAPSQRWSLQASRTALLD